MHRANLIVRHLVPSAVSARALPGAAAHARALSGATGPDKSTFSALVIDKADKSKPQTVSIKQLTDADLPIGDVTVDVEYSTINYKDALAVTGVSPVVRSFPMVPGIDFAGTVRESFNPRFKAGDKVLLNGYGVGEKHWGGLSQRARVQGDWLIALPPRFTTEQAMMIGTAGYTAMLCVMALQRQGVKPESGDVLVTGACGGVGSVAVSLLSSLGYSVYGSTGRPAELPFLQSLGAKGIVDRAELSGPAKPLGKERWAGAVDSVGSHTLANVLSQVKYGGAVAACGLAQGMDLPGSVAPFILRGVTLVGVDSVMAPRAVREEAWKTLAALKQLSNLTAINSATCHLKDVLATSRELLAGKVKGRVVVDVNGGSEQ